MKNFRTCFGLAIACLATLAATPSWAQRACSDLPSHDLLEAALKGAIAPTGGPSNGGFDFHAWAVIVDRDGRVCAVVKSAEDRGDLFPISRLAAAFKATAANANSLPGVAISTAQLHAGVQPGALLFTLPLASPPDPRVAYRDPSGKSLAGANQFGEERDPLAGKVVGGFSALGGGLPLYSGPGTIVGGLGVGGDTGCADHNIAWRIREALGLDHVVFGPNPQNGDDGIVYDVGEDGKSASGVGYPFCGGAEPAVAVEIGAGSVAEP